METKKSISDPEERMIEISEYEQEKENELEKAQ
jgi:hypothetical protein